MATRGDSRGLRTRLAWSGYVARRAPFERRFPFRSAERIEDAQRRRLRATIDHAHEHVPYYRETMRRIGLAPGDIRAEADLARLPLLDRGQVQADPEYFLSQAEPVGSYVEQRSGGSTGDPVSLLYHPFSLFEQAVYTQRLHSIISRLAGRWRYREARVADPSASPGGGPNLKETFSRLSLISPAVAVNRRQFAGSTPLDRLIEEIEEFEPHVISGFGSFNEMLFSHALRTGRPTHLPKLAVYAGDGMSPSARAMIAREFGIRVLSAYTASEAFQIGFECGHDSGYHLNTDLFPIRIISADGRELPLAESGEVVVSNLQARGTILLNYRLNDIAAKLPGRCGCGRTLPLLSMVQGRADEWLEDCDGRQIHSQSVRGFIQNELDVLRFQLVQESRTHTRLALVVAPGTDREGLRSRLAPSLRSVLGERTSLEVSFVETLPRTPAGKVRPVISLSGSRG